MIGFDQAEIRRIKAQEQRERGVQAIQSTESLAEELETEEATDEELLNIDNDMLQEYSDEIISMLNEIVEE